MRTQRGRAKKLAVAFWFHLHGEPAWKCDECRAARLELSRKCGFLRCTPDPSSAPVWAAGGLILAECPKPVITASSLALLAAYVWWKRSGAGFDLQLRTKCAEAFNLLDRLSAQAAREQANGAQPVGGNTAHQQGDEAQWH